MRVSNELRNEIRNWATKAAYEDAQKAGKVEDSDDYDRYIEERVWYHEKRAYWKIQKRIEEA